ncbi:MAG: bifunctional UDP-sugar hydrolase/5'-nucleotidase [Candidatus Aerophobetes bacterium]|nr:bifunctional UDP-sugar hydrolase/5'-nucleotidase [Candidatus Aerophobetes bacterium]
MINLTKEAKNILIIIFLPIITVIFFSYSAEAKEVRKLTVLYTNDLHTHLLPFDLKELKNRGGIISLTSLISKIKEENEEILLLDAGDFLQDYFDIPTSLLKGKPMVEWMNEIGYDATVLGNHEFYYGPQGLEDRLKEINFPLLSANISGLNKVNPYIIREINGVKVGIVGLTTLDYIPFQRFLNLKFSNPISTAKKYVKLLSSKVDILIFLNHLGVGADKYLAGEVPGIDIIIGGHSHTKIDKPIKIKDTYIVQAFKWGAYLGKIEVEIKKDGKGKYFLSQLKHNLIPVCNIKNDERNKLLRENYQKKISKKMPSVGGFAAFLMIVALALFGG